MVGFGLRKKQFLMESHHKSPLFPSKGVQPVTMDSESCDYQIHNVSKFQPRSRQVTNVSSMMYTYSDPDSRPAVTDGNTHLL